MTLSNIDGIASNAQSQPEAFEFCDLPTLISISAKQRPSSTAVVDGTLRIDYSTLYAQVLKVSAALQRTGLLAHDCMPSVLEAAMTICPSSWAPCALE